MLLTSLILALFIGLLLTALFYVGLGARGPWHSFWFFLLVVALATWVGSLWMTPFGPPLFGVYWLPALLLGLFFALLLAAVTPPAPEAAPATMRAAESTIVGLNVFFWVLIAGLVIAAFVALI